MDTIPNRAMPILAALSAMILFLIAGPIPAPAIPDKPNLLFISSFSKDLPAQNAIESGLEESLHFSQGEYNVFFEFLDIPRLPEKNLREGFPRLLESKYRDTKPDYLVIWGNAATELLIADPGFFSGTRRIYLEITEETDIKVRRHVNTAAIIGSVSNYQACIEEVLRLEPLEHLLVIGTTDDAEARIRLEDLKKALAVNAPTLKVEYLLDRTLEEVASRLENVSRKKAAAFYLLMFSDGEGHHMTPYNAVSRLAARSAVPIYSAWESLMGSGIVGGYQLSLELIGFQLGETIRAFERGDTPAHLSPMRRSYDWTALRHWNIDTRRLPEEALIINRPPNIIAQYRYHILAVGCIVLLLAALSLTLFRALRRQKQTAEELAKWWQIFQHADWGVAVGMAGTQTIELLNPAFARLHGYSVKELTGKEIETLFVPEFREQLPDIIKKCHDVGYYAFEADHLRRDGTMFPVHHDVTTVKDERGTPLYRIVNILDITERKRNEEELRKHRSHLEVLVEQRTVEIRKAHQALLDSTERYRSLSNASFEGIVISHEGSILETNAALAGMFGYPANELVGMELATLFTPELRAEVRHKILAEDEEPYRSTGLTKEGTSFPVEVHARMFSYKGHRARVTAIRDLSERQQAQERLEKSERFLAAILDAIQDGIVVLDGDLTIIRTNVIMTGRFADRLPLTGRKCHELFLCHRESCKLCPARRALETRKREMGELQMTKTGAAAQFLEMQAFPMANAEGEVETIVMFIRDITERKRDEELLKEREQLYRSLFENNISIILMIDPATAKIHDANPSACKFYGYSRKALTGMKITDINMLSSEEVFQEMERAKAERRNYFHFRHRLADGTSREVEVFSGPITVSGQSLLCSIIHDISERRAAELEREQLIGSLQKSLAEVKTLRGFLPICASCKKIRDDHGYWNQLEEYIRNHSEAEFSHGICPDCAAKLYPFLDFSKGRGGVE